MTVNKLLTKKNFKDLNDTTRIKYIVVHYVGATGGAEANCKYFEKYYRGASAHYFIGHKGEVWQCVEDGDIAWHCGASKYKHKYCRNHNSIGVEMCCKKDSKGKWYFANDTVEATLALVKRLMKKYGVPAANVIRHYDVSGKICPEPYVRDSKAWSEFKNNLTKTNTKTVSQIAKEVIAGRWGNGNDRKKALNAAGYNYLAIQTEVNKILKFIENVEKNLFISSYIFRILYIEINKPF